MLNQRDFEFLKIIGSGTFGKVFLAKLIGSNKYYAIKRMEMQLLKESRQLDNIYNEVNILKELQQCPLIVKFMNHIESGPYIFLVMEYVKGGELFYYIKKYGKFPPDAVRFFACEVLSALRFLHRKGILYRDLKPENILVNSDGHAKLADFGFATRTNENVYLLCGTPEYMAPEKLHGNGDTQETDYWALGCLIYEMLCGNPPYYSKKTDEIYKRILTEAVVFPDEITGTARDLIKKLLIKEKDRRLGHHGVDEIMNHPYFDGIVWKDVENLKMKPPFMPNLYQFQCADTDSCDPLKRKAEYKPVHGHRRLFRL